VRLSDLRHLARVIPIERIISLLIKIAIFCTGALIGLLYGMS
jgi:hypothetical protein